MSEPINFKNMIASMLLNMLKIFVALCSAFALLFATIVLSSGFTVLGF